MCTQCDGRIPFDADTCPYCATDQAKVLAPVAPGKEQHHQSLQDSLTAPYAPSYAARAIPSLQPSKINPTKPVNESMMEKKNNNMSASLMGIPTIPASSVEESASKESKSAFMPILLMLMAGNLLTIGLLQLLFSDRGFLRLEWDSSYWFLYCLGALPLFYLGLKKAGALKD